jgi:hypothetical protein
MEKGEVSVGGTWLGGGSGGGDGSWRKEDSGDVDGEAASLEE